MTDEERDDFLNEATYTVAGVWYDFTGRELDSDELMDINDWLDSYFDRDRGKKKDEQG